MCNEAQYDADQIIELIIARLAEIVEEIRNENITDQNEWTGSILTGLGTLGKSEELLTVLGESGNEELFSVCASQSEEGGFPEADWGEFLYDITWSKLDAPCQNPDDTWNTDAHMKVLVLAGESEWGNAGASPQQQYELVLEDFQKLLVARTTVRLMIYDEDRAGADTNEKLLEHIQAFCRCQSSCPWWTTPFAWLLKRIRACCGCKSDDHYLLVARTGNGQEAHLKLAKVVVDRAHNAKIEDLGEI